MEGDTCREAGGTLPTVGFRRSTRSRTSSFDGTPAIPEIMPASPPKHIHGGSRTDFSAAGRLGTCQYVLSPSWPGRGLRRTTLCVASFLALIGLYSIRSFRPWLPDGELPARGIGKALGDEITGLAARAALEGGTGLHRGVSKARILFDRGLFHGHGTSSSETVQGSSSTRYTVSVKRRQGNQIYVPCGIKFKSPKKPQVHMPARRSF